VATTLVAILVSSLVRPSAAGPVPGPFGLLAQSTWLHALGYAGLATVLAYALQPGPWPAWQALTLAFAATTAYGVGIELLQSTVAYRTFETADISVNAVGAAVAVVGWYLLLGRAEFYRCRRLDALRPPIG
jgi:VanZ family protein